MKFLRLGEAGHEAPIVEAEGEHYSLLSITGDIDARFWDGGGPTLAAEALAAGTLDRVSLDGQRIGSPIARPGAVICIGMNYAAHAAESGSAPPQAPVVFLKTPNTVVGPTDPVGIPPGAEKTDWEVELGVVISRRASYLKSTEEASEVGS